jgi:hypothetical protein
MVFCVFTQSTAMNQAKLFFSTHTRLYSHVHSHHRRQGARGQYLGPAAHQVRCLLLARSRVSRFPSTACDSSSRCLFVARAKSNTEFERRYSSPADRASSSIVCDQTGVLSIFSSNKDYPAPQRRVVVKDEWQASHVFDQQLRPQTRVDRRLLPPALAGRVVLQVDQTAPADQDVFWNHRERGQGADLDCSLHLRADRDCQETLTSAQ